jgi:hypothetical protein
MILMSGKPACGMSEGHEDFLRRLGKFGSLPWGSVALKSDMGTSQRPDAPILTRMMLAVRYVTLTFSDLTSAPSSGCVLACCVKTPLRLLPVHAQRAPRTQYSCNASQSHV